MCAGAVYRRKRAPSFLDIQFWNEHAILLGHFALLLVYYVTRFDNDVSLLDVLYRLHISHLRDICLKTPVATVIE